MNEFRTGKCDSMPTVKFTNEKKSVEVSDGANLRKVALKNGVQIYSGPHTLLNCRGLGQCGSCTVLIKSGDVSRKRLWEKVRAALGPFLSLKLLSNSGDGEVRLACQTRAHGDCEVVTKPGINWHGEKFWA
jgi:ferredoxin